MTQRRFAKVVAAMGVGVLVVGTLLGVGLSTALGGAEHGGAAPAAGSPEAEAHQRQLEQIRAEKAWVFAVSIAAVISLACLGAGYAVAKVGSAAMGAASEKPELMGRALLFVALAEGIAIYGVLAGILLYTKI
jgi:V/A-type H+-transporting ATPase subunit K